MVKVFTKLSKSTKVSSGRNQRLKYLKGNEDNVLYQIANCAINCFPYVFFVIMLVPCVIADMPFARAVINDRKTGVGTMSDVKYGACVAVIRMRIPKREFGMV